MQIAWLEQIKNAVQALINMVSELSAVRAREELDLARSTSSGTTTMTGGEQTLYEGSGDFPFEFCGGIVSLANMASGDMVVIREYATIASGGSYQLLKTTTYTGAQTTAVEVSRRYNRYGFKVTAQQTAGTYRALVHEWYDAKRGY